MEIKDQIRQLIKELHGSWGTPLTSVKSQEMEDKLNLKLPEEYKEFLQTYGYLEVKGLEVFGDRKGLLDPYLSALQETLELRESYPDTFPKNCVAVTPDGFGNFHCVVCSGRDYGKVIFWQHDCPIKEVYPNNPKPEYFETHPEAPREDFWLEGPNFWTWLLKKLQQEKGRWEEIEKKLEEKRRTKQS